MLCCFVILLPWYLKRHALYVNQSRQNELYQGKLNELRLDLEQGDIDEQAYQTALEDLKLQLASELANKHSAKSSKMRRGYLFVLPVITLVIAFSIYLNQGKIEQMTQYFQAQEDTNELAKKLLMGNESFSQAELDAFYIGLRSNLQNKPEDATGWLLLGRVAYSQGQLENAMHAYEKVLELEPNKYSAQMSYAQTLLATNDEGYFKKALNVYNQVLKVSPNDSEALVMAGYVSFELNNKDAAKIYWRGALASLDKNDPRVQAIAQSMPELAQEFGIEVNMPQITQTASSDSAGVSGKKLLVKLNVSEQTKTKLTDYSYLVVFARPQLSGPPAAVVRLPINGSLPTEVELSDQNAMVAGFNLSSLSQVYVTVRLSKDADVTLADDEIEKNSSALDLGDETASITIEL